MLFSVIIVLLYITASFSNEVVEINDNTFHRVVLETNEFWLVDFYAPWCGHCKKLTPVLSEVSLITMERMRIGKVNAVASKELAKAYKVDSYPTLLYFKDGASGEYKGPRTVVGMTEFMRKMIEPATTNITSLVELHSLLSMGSVIFVFHEGRDADTRRDMSEAFHKTAIELRSESHFATMQSVHPEDVSKIVRYEHLRTPRFLPDLSGVITVENVTAFVRHNKWPLISTLDADSFDALADIGKKMMVAMVDHSREDTAVLLSNFESVIRTLAGEDEEKDSLIFCVMDATQYKRFAGEHEALPNSILVLDPTKDLHYSTNREEDLSIEGLRLLVLDFLQSSPAGEGSRPMKQSVSFDSTVWGRIKYNFRKYYPWSMTVFLPVVLLAVSFLAPYPEDKDKVE